MSNTVNNGIPFVPENTIDPAAGLNESLLTVDALLQLAVVSVGGNTPPSSPTNGARYIVGTAPTGAWAGRANQVAQWLDGGWRFYAARYALNAADGMWYVRQSTAWITYAGPATAWGSITGTLSAQTDLQGALDGKVGTGDSRLTDAREWSAETVSQAEAEAGTATTRRAWTAERVRQAIVAWWNSVSSAWGRGFVAAADAAAGRTALELGTAATRAALGSTGSLYSRDSILGTVSQSAGIPTGAIIERGSNANGEYVRYADGTQICMTTGDFAAAPVGALIGFAKAHPSLFHSITSVQYSAHTQLGAGAQDGVGAIYANGIYTHVNTSTLDANCYTYRERVSEPVRFYFTTIGRWY